VVLDCHLDSVTDYRCHFLRVTADCDQPVTWRISLSSVVSTLSSVVSSCLSVVSQAVVLVGECTRGLGGHQVTVSGGHRKGVKGTGNSVGGEHVHGVGVDRSTGPRAHGQGLEAQNRAGATPRG